ncbi:MAG TPA: AsmA family protein [Candidatus Sulfotelmatobacter sp.]|nr:AsmA family protein [Candidatus Sulfotelmatobacter sp.]
MKRILKIVGIAIAILLVVVIAVPFFIDANAFRPKLETELTAALGRPVTVGNLSLSLLSGSVSADNIAIADDAAFSKSPFVQAKSLKVGVEMMPLIFSRTLNVTEVTLNQPEITLVKSENGEKWNFSSLGTSSAASSQETKAPPEPMKAEPQSKEKQKSTPEAKESPAQPAPAGTAPAGGTTSPNITVKKLNVKDGRLTVSRVGKSQPHVYDKVDITVTDFAFRSSFPFSMSADLPGGGSMHLDGKAGPINPDDAARTPLDAKLVIKGMKLEQSGFIDPEMGISGIADLDGSLSSDGHEAKVNGALKATSLKVVAKGSPATKPVDVTLTVVHDLVKQEGQIKQGDINMGGAIAHLSGTYDIHSTTTTVNLKLDGQGMPVDNLEAMLPAVGVMLPPKASLKGGTLSINTVSTGPVDKLVTTGTVRLENSSLAGFDLGQRLSSISALAGKQSGSTTQIKNFSSDLKVAPSGTDANNINLDVPSIGVMTGAGTVSPNNDLAFKLNASVAGLAVPINVSGTTSDPKFAPDMKGVATGLLKNALGGKNGQQQNPLSGLGGLFGKKK